MIAQTTQILSMSIWNPFCRKTRRVWKFAWNPRWVAWMWINLNEWGNPHPDPRQASCTSTAEILGYASANDFNVYIKVQSANKRVNADSWDVYIGQWSGKSDHRNDHSPDHWPLSCLLTTKLRQDSCSYHKVLIPFFSKDRKLLKCCSPGSLQVNDSWE